MPETVPVIIDGKQYDVDKGIYLIEAIKQATGFDVPHYCYHPGLSVSGNCRMCIVNIKQFPKPTTSCTTKVDLVRSREGGMVPMEVETHSEELTHIRESIMEFLLINHPLDCPQCDKAGECDLQNYAYTYGKDKSRFVEEKNIRHTKVLGPTVKIWGNRCIACDRCTRFLNEVTGTGELSLVARGDKSVIDIFPGYPLDNPMSLNVTEVCPVGALQSRDFLYSARVWFTDQTESIVPNARGDNVIIDALHGEVKRIRPRHNPDVNDYWIADEDRLGYKTAYDDRVDTYLDGGAPTTSDQAIQGFVDALKGADKSQLGIAVNAWMTNEELHLIKQWVAEGGPLEGAKVYAWAKPDGLDWTAKNGWRIEPDKNPNRHGLHLIFPEATITTDRVQMVKDAQSDGVTSMVYIGGPIDVPIEDGLVEALESFQWLAVLSPFMDAIAKAATTKGLVIPTCICYEKTGTWVSIQDRVQICRRAGEQPDGVVEDLELLQAITKRFADEDVGMPLPALVVFGKLAESVPAFEGMSYRTIGKLGQPLATAPSAT